MYEKYTGFPAADYGEENNRNTNRKNTVSNKPRSGNSSRSGASGNRSASNREMSAYNHSGSRSANTFSYSGNSRGNGSANRSARAAARRRKQRRQRLAVRPKKIAAQHDFIHHVVGTRFPRNDCVGVSHKFQRVEMRVEELQRLFVARLRVIHEVPPGASPAARDERLLEFPTRLPVLQSCRFLRKQVAPPLHQLIVAVDALLPRGLP